MKRKKDVKVVLVGDSGVGKSSILLRFVTNDFKSHLESTIGAAFLTKIIEVNDVAINFQIWDTAGQEKYKSLVPLYYKDSAIAILVYDTTNMESFKSLKNWVTEIRQKGPKRLKIAIAGNKSDLIEDEQVPFSEATSYAQEISAVFKLTSAKENKGISDLFVALADQLNLSDSSTDLSQIKSATDRLQVGGNKNKNKNGLKQESQNGGCCGGGGGGA